MNHLDKEQNIVENLVLSEMIIYPWTLVMLAFVMLKDDS